MSKPARRDTRLVSRRAGFFFPSRGGDTKTESKMTFETTMTERHSGQFGEQSEATRSAFVDTLEAMEDGLKDAMHEAHDAVTAAADAVNETVEASGKATREGARGAADALAWVLDVPGHVSRHPWILLGAVILAGLLLAHRSRRQ